MPVRRSLSLFVASLALILPQVVSADGRLLATGGASQLEGAAGGGIVPWAVLAGYATDSETSATAFLSTVDSGDYRLAATGAAFTWRNRIEVSAARQTLEMPTLVAQLGLTPGSELEQDVFGLKLRLHGDLVYSAWPQLSLGVQHKRNRAFDIPQAVGAARDTDTEFYLAASKLWLAGPGGRNLVLNATLRRTRANQIGLLGFGGDRDEGFSTVLEASAAVFLDRRTALGVEYRQKPDNLGFASEDDWRDLFIAWFPSKRLSLVAAWVELGSIAGIENQNAFYLSVQGGF